MENKLSKIAEQKNEVRGKIMEIAGEIQRFISSPNKIPSSVVNGTLSQVLAYKESAEDATTKYHVWNPPGDSKSLKQLNNIHQSLLAMLNRLQNG